MILIYYAYEAGFPLFSSQRARALDRGVLFPAILISCKFYIKNLNLNFENYVNLTYLNFYINFEKLK